jgi:hypothetical protein
VWRIFIKFRINQVSKQTQWQSRDALRLTQPTCASHIHERFGRNSTETFGQLYVMTATLCFRTWQNNISCTLHFYSDLDTMRHTTCRNETRSAKATISLRNEGCISVSPNYPHLLSDVGETLYKSAHNSIQRVSYVVHIGAGKVAAIFLWQYSELLYTLQGQSVRRNTRVGLSARSGHSYLWVISLLHLLQNQPMWRSLPSQSNKGANGHDRQSNPRPDCTDVLKYTLRSSTLNCNNL